MFCSAFSNIWGGGMGLFWFVFFLLNTVIQSLLSCKTNMDVYSCAGNKIARAI